jgi:hypothetical protein
VLSGEDNYNEYFNLKETEGINSKFELYGADNMLMLTNSGSYFILQILLIIAFFMYVLLHKMAVRLWKYDGIRAMGIWIEGKQNFTYMWKVSEKLIMESHFDLCIAVNINMYGFRVYRLEFAEFFKGLGN